MRLVQGLEEQTQASTRTIDLLLSIVTAVYKGATAAGIQVPPPPAGLDERFRTQLLEPVRQGILTSMLHAYRSVSENELATYQSFLKTPSAIAFNDSIWNAMNASFIEGGQEFGRIMAEKKK